MINPYKTRILHTNLGTERFPAIAAGAAAGQKDGHAPRSPCLEAMQLPFSEWALMGSRLKEVYGDFVVLEDLNIVHSLQEEEVE